MRKLQNNQTGFSGIETVMALVILILIGTVGWFVYQSHNKTDSKSTQTTASSTPATSSATDPNTAAIMSGIKQALATKYTVQAGNNNPPDANSISVQSSAGNGPTQSVSGYNYFVSAKGAYLGIIAYLPDASGLPATSITSSIQSLVASELAKLHVVAIAKPVDSEAAANYQNATAVCYFDDTATPADPIEISCADKSAYASAAATIKPLATAYEAANPSTSGQDSFSPPTITTSKTPGYKSATMGVDEAMSYYYQKDSIWHFYAAGQAGFYCDFATNSDSSLNNSDARLAFLGQPCTDSNGNDSTVQ